MGEKDQTINYLTQLKRELTAKRERLLKPVQEVEKELEQISGALGVILRASSERVEEVEEFPITKLRGMTHSQSVVAIARYYGGTVKAQDAKRILIRAGIMADTKNTTNMVHNAFMQSNQFDRVGRGIFRLKEHIGTRPLTARSSNVAAVIDALFPEKPVQ